MAATTGSPAEPQHEPAAPTDGTFDGNEAPISIETQQMTPTPETGELLSRVASEISQAFQSSLTQVISDIGHHYGVEPTASTFEWMEKGEGRERDEQLPGKVGNDVDVRRILRDLQLSRLHVSRLQQVVHVLQHEQSRLNQRVALFNSLSGKLKRELVDERLALIDAKNEIQELRRKYTVEDTASVGAGGTSPHSPLQDHPWSSPKQAMVGSVGGAAGPGTTGGARGGSSLMAFNFYPSASARGAGDEESAEDEEPLSPTSSSQTLRSHLMGQFLPSALLDSPQVTPKHGKTFASHALPEEKGSHPLSQLKGDIKSRSFPTLPLPEVSSTFSIKKQQGRYDVADTETKETSQGDNRRGSTMAAAVSPLKLSMLSELFETIPVEELQLILRRFHDDESSAMDHIVRTHPSFHPAVGADARIESGSMASGASGASPLPSRSSSVSHSKTILHRSSSQTGSSGPPPGSSNNWKTEICMYYMQGKCNKTKRTCSFAHGDTDLVRPSGSSGASSSKYGPNYKTRLCQAFDNCACTKSRRDCPMAHGINDLRDAGMESGGAGASQPMLPSATPRLQSYKTELCYYFLKGNCNYSKEECRFAHGQNDLRTVESNTAQIAAAAVAASGSGFTPTSPVLPPPSVLMEKQLQLQHQYQQQYHHPQPSSMALFHPPQPSPIQQQSFALQHQIQLQQSSRGNGGAGQHQFNYQHQQYDLVQQQQQQQYMPPSGQYRYPKSTEDKRSSAVGRPPQRESSSSWSTFDATGLPPPEY
ncbi:hypothetical protein PsorP6_000555 [Peronosclerospora sorghi]|uniref:Uncharacterized protein n=1 Tax=Peronosclerospora sorghi TaxID=230839 RepID=A0ACC0WWK7_9STRA|nr:hypothetical protein PsorP6_000555 [Peronosclerospora sorghi]